MNAPRRIQSALISVFHKEGLEPIVEQLKRLGVTIYSTGGTQKAVEAMGAEVVPVESITDYPSILGGRVKTLHPKVFGGILNRRDLAEDVAHMEEYQLPHIDLFIVDLYPFEATVAQGGTHQQIIETRGFWMVSRQRPCLLVGSIAQPRCCHRSLSSSSMVTCS